MKNEDKIISITKSLLTNLGFSFDEVGCELDPQHNIYICEVKGSNNRELVGKDGENLDSINHLVRRLCEKEGVETDVIRGVFVETNGFLREKIKNLETVAHMMAERAKFFKKDTELDPMRSFDRKIIHTFLEGKPNIKTESTGFGKTRRVVIKYFE